MRRIKIGAGDAAIAMDDAGQAVTHAQIDGVVDAFERFGYFRFRGADISPKPAPTKHLPVAATSAKPLAVAA